MVTKRGTNEFRGSGRYFYDDKYQDSYQAEASVPAWSGGDTSSATNEINDRSRTRASSSAVRSWRDRSVDLGRACR